LSSGLWAWPSIIQIQLQSQKLIRSATPTLRKIAENGAPRLWVHLGKGESKAGAPGETAGLDDEKEVELLKKKADVEAAQHKVFEDAKKSGVDPKLVEQAKANYRKAQALYDLDLHVKKSVSGMRPDVGDAAQAAKNPEAVDPKKLFNRINSLYDSGRLQEALGEEGADDLLEHVNDHLIQQKKILRNQAVAKTAAKYAGYGVAGAAGGSTVSHLIP